MSEINKINSSNPFNNMRIDQTGADRKYYKDPTEDEKSKNQYHQSKQQKQNQAKPQNPGMEQMLEALRKRQEQEQLDNESYTDRRSVRQREVNKQASEDYVRQVNEYRQKKAKKADKSTQGKKDFNIRYSERVKDIGRDHIAKILDKKIESKVFDDTRKMADIKNETQDKKGKTPAKMDTSRLRPEVSDMIGKRKGAGPESGKVLSSESHDNKLLNLAVNKLKSKLGGAHLGARSIDEPVFKPILQGDDLAYQKMSNKKANVTISANLNEVKQSFDHARALAQGGDNTYIPLETADIQKALFSHNLPAHHANLASLKAISMQLQDSSPLFINAAIMATALKVPPDLDLIQGIMRYFDTFLKYSRWSTINKLYRFLVMKKQSYLMSLKQLSMPKPNVSIPLDDPIFLQTLSVPKMAGSSQPVSAPLVPMNTFIEQSPLYHTLNTQEAHKQNISEAEISQAYALEEGQLKETLGTYLKKYGLPASKVMINQLFQSAKGDEVRAQALALQLAQKKGLKPEVTDDIQARLQRLTPEERNKKLPQLLTLLENVDLSQIQSQDKSRAMGWKGFFQQYFPGFSAAPFENHMAARESMLWIGARFLNTPFLKGLLPALTTQLLQAPEVTLKRIAQLGEQLQSLLAQNKFTPDQFKSNANEWLQSALNFMEGRTPQLQVPPVIQTTSGTPPSPFSSPLQELLQTHYPGVNFQLFQTEASKESLLVLHQKFERTDFLNKLMPQIRDLLRQAPERTLQNLSQLLPLLKNAPEAKSLNLQTLYQSVVKFLQKGQGLEQVRVHLQPNLATQSQNAKSTPHVQVQQSSAQATAPQTTLPQGNTTSQTSSQALPSQNAAPPAPAAPQGPIYITKNTASAQLSKDIPADQSVFLKSHYPGVSLRTFTPHPEARANLVLLHQLAQRNESLNDLIPRMTQLFRDQPTPALETLAQMKNLVLPTTLKAPQISQIYQQLMVQLEGKPIPAQVNKGNVQGQISTPLEGLVQRFYPQQSGGSLPIFSKLDSQSQTHFLQLHQLFSQFEPNKSQTQSLVQLWQHPSPEMPARLSKLSSFTQAIFQHLNLNPYQTQMIPTTLQTRLVQDIIQFLKTGQADSLKATTQKLISEPPMMKDVLRQVQERFRQFDVQLQNPALLQEISQLAKGSTDRIDAQAILSKGNFPLFEGNIKVVLQYIQNLPPQTRFLSVSQILKFLSGDLVQMINQQVQGQGQTESKQQPLTPVQTHFATLQQALTSQLPLLPENLSQLGAMIQQQQIPPALNLQGLTTQIQTLMTTLSQNMPAQPWAPVLLNYLGTLNTQLSQVVQLFSQPMTQTHLQKVMQELPLLMNQLQKSFQGFETQIKGAFPLPNSTNPSWHARLPAILGLIQNQLPQNSQVHQLLNQLLPHLNQGLPEMAKMEHQLLGLQKQILGMTGQNTSLLPQAPQNLSVPPAQIQELVKMPLPQDLENIQKYLQTLGLQPSPQLLAEIQTLMGGSQDRLDAIGILMKGQMPLLPAHIQIVANYVKQIPPLERFKSISKILMYLSDALIKQMKQELKSPKQETFKKAMANKGQQLTPEAENKSERLLKQFKAPMSEHTLEAARYLLQSPLAKTAENLTQVQTLLTQELSPKAFFNELSNLLQRLNALLQNTKLPAPLMEFVKAVMQYMQDLPKLLQPGQQNLSHWMMGVMAKLKDRETQFFEQLKGLNIPLPAQGQTGWIQALQKQFEQIFQALLQEHPELQEEAEHLKQALQNQLKNLQSQLESLTTVMQSEAQSQPTQAETPSPQTIIPLFLDNFKYPVQLAIHDEPDSDDTSTGEKGVNISLSVQTHTLGSLLFSFELTTQGLKLRLGVQDTKIQTFIKPYLESLTYKLSQFPWEVAPVQSYVLTTAHNPQHILAQKIQTRYHHSPIGAL